MKIFITGTTGFLGRSLKEYLFEHQIHTWNRNDSDITDVIDSIQPEVIIHCAAEIYDSERMFDSNIVLVYKILECLRKKHKKTRLIQIGSSAEYGPVERPTNERDLINPVNMYQATKGANTLMCQAYARQFDLNTCVVRIYSGYGAYEKPHRLFPSLYRAFFKGEAMTLYAGEHDFIYVEDFCRAINILLKKEWPKAEIVNIGSGTQTSNLEVLRTWEKVTGKKADVTYKDRMLKPFESKIWCCDPDYAQTKYKFKAEYSLAQGIEDMIHKIEKENHA